MRKAAGWAAVLLVPAILAAGVALLPIGAGGGSTTSVRLGLLLILGGGLLATLGDGSGIRGSAALLVGALAAGGIAWSSGWPVARAAEAAAVIGIGWAIPWSAGQLVGALGLEAAGRLVHLAGFGFLLGTLWLIPAPMSEGARYAFHGDLPAWILGPNPLVRLHGAIGDEDWLRGPVLYPRVGDRYYRYPTFAEGAVPLVSTPIIVLTLAGFIRWRRGHGARLRTPRP